MKHLAPIWGDPPKGPGGDLLLYRVGYRAPVLALNHSTYTSHPAPINAFDATFSPRRKQFAEPVLPLAVYLVAPFVFVIDIYLRESDRLNEPDPHPP